MKRGGEITAGFFLPFAAALIVLVTAQIWLNAFDAEMTGDAASHYVSGRFIADLLRGGLLHPIEQLRDFAAHYPIVGISELGRPHTMGSKLYGVLLPRSINGCWC